jgi:N-ethylmaleimide reductase
MDSKRNLFTPVQLEPYILPNRIFMAPITWLRAIDSIPNSLMATYCPQRASARLIVTECTMVSPISLGYMSHVGKYSDDRWEDDSW